MHVLERLQCSRSAASPNAVPAFREKFLEGEACKVEALELERGCMTATTPDMMMNLGRGGESDEARIAVVENATAEGEGKRRTCSRQSRPL